MTNKVETTLYNNDDSITTIEVSIISKQTLLKIRNEVNYKLILVILIQSIIQLVSRDKVSVASFITMELLLLK